jgi:hypothetical protein
MTARLGDTSNTVLLNRGYRHYGQPLQSTLDAIVEIRDDDNDKDFIAHNQRLCTCDCDHCRNISPHAVHNCFYKCMERLTFDDKTMKKLGLYADCQC